MSAPYPLRCERNMAGPEEDCGRRLAYVPCGQPAHWRIEDGWLACEEHALEYLRESDRSAVTGEMDGEPVEIGEDGGIRRAS
jgi:hypothetical protein